MERLTQAKKRLLLVLFILIISASAYSNIFSNRFVGDDYDFIFNWPTITSVKNIPQLFLGDTPERHEGTYRPFRGVLYTLVFALGKQDSRAYHTFSLIVLLVSTVFVYLVAKELVKDLKIALSTALLFGLHPLHTEAITFITASFDSAGIAFAFGAFYCFIRYHKTRQKFWQWLSLTALSMAILTNEIAIVTPALLVTYLFTLKQKKLKLGFKETRKFWLISLVYLVVRFLFLDITSRGEYVGGSWYYSYLISIKALLWYIYLSIWPKDLSLIHELPGGFQTYNYHDLTLEVARQQSWSEPIVILGVLMICSISGCAYYLRKRQPLITFGVAWFFISLLPVMNLIPTAVSFSERYAFMASFGFCLLLSSLLWKLPKQLFKKPLSKQTKKQAEIMALTFITAVSVLYWFRTYTRNPDWFSETTYWGKAVKDYPNHFVARLNLAEAYQVEGKPVEAINSYKYLLTMKPDFATAYHRIGQIKQFYGDFPVALENYKQALLLEPELGETKYFKAQAHYYYAKELNQQGKMRASIFNLKEALKILPELTEASWLLDDLCRGNPQLCSSDPVD